MNRSFKLNLLLILSICLWVNHISISQPKKMKPTILYVFDPLCGWCYGFTPVMQKIESKFKDKYNFDVISGGMVLGANEEPITKIAPYISQAHKRVEEYSGIKFGEAFLKQRLWDSTYIMSSLKPSIALEVFKHFNAEKAVEFAHKIQAIFYYDGKSLHDNNTYLELISSYKINENEYISLLESKEFKEKTMEMFRKSSKLGVNGFPTVVFINNESIKVLTRGFSTEQELERILNNIK